MHRDRGDSGVYVGTEPPEDPQQTVWIDVSEDPTELAHGTTFFPTVSAEGVLSWTNDGNQLNPTPVSIRGPQGLVGDTGESGATFTPSVDSNGNISWTNDGDLTNPSTINLKGPKGDPGNSGVFVGSESPTATANVWIDPTGTI